MRNTKAHRLEPLATRVMSGEGPASTSCMPRKTWRPGPSGGMAPRNESRPMSFGMSCEWSMLPRCIHAPARLCSPHGHRNRPDDRLRRASDLCRWDRECALRSMPCTVVGWHADDPGQSHAAAQSLDAWRRCHADGPTRRNLRSVQRYVSVRRVQRHALWYVRWLTLPLSRHHRPGKASPDSA